MNGMVERFIDEDGVVALSGLLEPAPPPHQRVTVTVTRSEARAAVGTMNDNVNGKIVHEAAEAIVGPDIPATEAAACAVAMLAAIGPRDVREAMIARRLVAIDNLAVETLRLARASTGLLRAAYAHQATALSQAATSLDEALERRRGGGQRVVEVKHVVVHNGGQAIVGPVTHIAPKAPSPPR
jgi:hypothetical protein